MVWLGLAINAVDRWSLLLPAILDPLLFLSASVLYGPLTRVAIGKSILGFLGDGYSSSVKNLARTRTPSGHKYMVHSFSDQILIVTFCPTKRPG